MKALLNSGRVSPFFTARYKLLRNIKEAGYDITVTGYQDDDKGNREAFGADYIHIPMARAGMNPICDLKVMNAYYKAIKEGNYDIVHSYTAKPNIYGSIAAKRAGVKKIFPTVNGLGYAFTDDTTNSLKSRIVRRVVSYLYKKAFSCATKVFFQNTDDAEEMVQRGLIAKDKCVVISGSGIDLEAFPYSDVSVSPMKFMIATRLLVTKGVRTFFEAARIVKRQHPEAIFQIAGSIDPNPDGIKQEELDSYINDGTIEFLGYVNDMPRALSECTVFVLPSYYREGIPHAILEAMSIGRPIISTRSPGCKETVRGLDDKGKGFNGFLIDTKNSQQLADAMCWMIDHPGEVKRMGLESRKYAEDRFDVEKVNRAMMETMGMG